MSNSKVQFKVLAIAAVLPIAAMEKELNEFGNQGYSIAHVQSDAYIILEKKN